MALADWELEWLLQPDTPEPIPAAKLFPPRPTWMARGACRDRPDVNFFPARGEDARPAMALCAECPVAEQCLAYAVREGLLGVWGGTSERERRRMRSRYTHVTRKGQFRSETSGTDG